jgi:DNA-binding IclR family transcriptional regulator
MISRIGMFRPLYCTAMGKALVSTLGAPERRLLFSALRFHHFTPKTITAAPKFEDEIVKIQTQGYAVDDEEVALGARCVAVSAAVCGGKLAAAVSVSAPIRRMPRDLVPSIAREVHTAVQTFAATVDCSAIHAPCVDSASA